MMEEQNKSRVQAIVTGRTLTEPDPRIEKRVIGACHTNVYLVISARGNAVLVDPADDAEQIIRWIQESGVRLRYIFVTHGHADHVLALEAVRDAFQVPVIISAIDAPRLLDPEGINERPYVTVPYKAVTPDILVQEGDELWLDELKLCFYGMPGHTDGSMAIVAGRTILTGDTLLCEGHGKTTLPGGDRERLIASIRRLLVDFPGDARVLPGHRQETTLQAEREYWKHH